MITEDLIEYIKLQLSKSISKDLIIQRLVEVGWKVEDINEGFLNIESSLVETLPTIEKKEENILVDSPINNLEQQETEEIKKIIDPYRELPEVIDPSVIENVNTNTNDTPVEKPISSGPIATSVEPLKIWIPTNIKPKIEIPSSNIPEVKKEEPVTTIPIIEKAPMEITPIEELLKEDIEPFKLEVPEEKKPEVIVPIVEIPKKVESSKIEVAPLELPKEEIKVKENVPIKETIPLININKIPVSNPISKTVIQIEKLPNMNSSAPVNKMSDVSPRSAMISSYNQDFINSSKEIKEEDPLVTKKRKNKLLKWMIAIITLCIVGGMVFSFVEGYLKIPWLNLNFSIVRKDPKIIMLNTPASVLQLKSYKTETNINISFPSLSNITTGLSSGEVVTSKDKDSVSINLKGASNNKDNKLFFDYILNFNSSILKNAIISDWKYNGDNLFVSVPDLTQILNNDAPTPANVSLTSNQLGLVVPLFSSNVQDIVKKIDVYNILSNDVPLYVKTETANIFKDFINGLTYTNKEDEVIHGVDTYHYEMTASRPITKKFLTSLSDLFITAELTPDQKTNLVEALGASTINSFEVWVGKNDGNLYQFKFTLNLPLSKVLGLNDSGIAGNEVDLNWMTTYYDIGVDNNIILPSDSIKIEDFVNNIKNTKIKDIVSSFKLQAVALHNAIGTYGAKSSLAGSCLIPESSSFFSPVGHPKGAGTAVSSIASSMNSLLSLTNGVGSCYSTSKTWALSLPLYTNPISFYCIDNRGTAITLSSSITGPVCSNPTVPVVPVVPVVAPVTTTIPVLPTATPTAKPTTTTPTTLPNIPKNITVPPLPPIPSVNKQ